MRRKSTVTRKALEPTVSGKACEGSWWLVYLPVCDAGRTQRESEDLHVDIVPKLPEAASCAH